MKSRIVIINCIFLVLICNSKVWSAPLLVDWAFQDDGLVFSAADYSFGQLPNHFNTSMFDENAGLGSITIAYNAIGTHLFTSFFDHEIVRGSNTYLNEYGGVHGAPEQGQSWEIDEPGWVFGDIFDNVLDGNLDNSNAVNVNAKDDVSMAMGWDFSLANDETALITLTLSETIPSGFYLAHNDPCGSHYFSSSLVISSSGSPVPEPASAILLGLGITCLVGFRREVRSK